jgi:hypothetical protein
MSMGRYDDAEKDLVEAINKDSKVRRCRLTLSIPR